jgi:hypothetical protein
MSALNEFVQARHLGQIERPDVVERPAVTNAGE